MNRQTVWAGNVTLAIISRPANPAFQKKQNCNFLQECTVFKSLLFFFSILLLLESNELPLVEDETKINITKKKKNPLVFKIRLVS